MKRKNVLSIKRLVGLCNRIEDPRRVWGNKRHELTTILIIALLSIISQYMYIRGKLIVPLQYDSE